MNQIKAAWKGDEKLWKVFWVFFLPVAIPLGIARGFAGWFLIQYESLVFAVLIWAVWVYVSLWRCAFNARWPGWGYIIRAFVILVIAWVGMNIADVVMPALLA